MTTRRGGSTPRAPGRRLAPALLAAVALASGAPASAQEARAAVVGDTIRVGDVVPVAVRAVLGRGERIEWPDTLPLGGPGSELENAARVRVRQDTLPDGRIQATGLYAVTPWRPGQYTLPDVALTVVGGTEAPRTLNASLPPFEVVSVLPPDTAGIQPRPARGVIGPSWLWWPFLLAFLALLALAILAWWLVRRRRRAPGLVPLTPALPPREAALAALDRAREARLAERGEMKRFYTEIAAAIRGYLAAVEPAWGEDLTTTEVLAAVRTDAGPAAATELGGTLRAADQVKFARRDPDTPVALAEWEAARSWVDAFRWNEPVIGESEEGRAA